MSLYGPSCVRVGQMNPILGRVTAVARQWSALRTFVENQGWICQREYRDEEMTGLTRDRAALREVLEACRAGPTNLVVVTDLSRINRNTPLLFELAAKLDGMGVRGKVIH